MAKAANGKRNAVIVIPAWNEEKLIKGVVAPCMEAKRQGLVREVIVIDDGSTDRTAEIAEKEGALVLRWEQRQGKGAAFLRGLNKCRELGAEIIITLDADLLNLKPKHIQKLLERVSRKGVKMAVMRVYEKGGTSSLGGMSGQRAIRMESFNFLFRKGRDGRMPKAAARFCEMMDGYGLEFALGRKMGKRVTVYFRTWPPLMARAPLLKSNGRQLIDLRRARALSKERRRKLREARRRRRERLAAAREKAKAAARAAKRRAR